MIYFIPLFLFVIILVFSFIKTAFRPYALASSGLLLGSVLFTISLKDSVNRGNYEIAEFLLMSALLIVYAIYLLIFLIVWWRFRKNKNIAGALQVKRGLLSSLFIFIFSIVLSYLDIPKKIKYTLQEKKAKTAYKYAFNLLSDSINENNNDYHLYAKRAALGKSFNFINQSYSFGNAATIISDAKKAYSLNPNDYDFVSTIANIFYGSSNVTVEPATEIIIEETTTTSNASGNENMNAYYTFFLHKAHLLLLDSLNKEILNAPTKGSWYFERGQLYKEMKDTANAMLDFEKLHSVQPKHTYSIYSELADFYLKKTDINKSNLYFRKHIGDYTFNKGPFEYLSERGRLKEDVNIIASINDYKEALSYKPKDYSVRNKLKLLYLKIGDSSNAKLYNE
jgi:hypothetical protein